MYCLEKVLFKKPIIWTCVLCVKNSAKPGVIVISDSEEEEIPPKKQANTPRATAAQSGPVAPPIQPSGGMKSAVPLRSKYSNGGRNKHFSKAGFALSSPAHYYLFSDFNPSCVPS